MSRSRLEGPLLHGGASRLDLVVAPPGSGKTTLLAQVAAAAAAAAIPVAWYRVTAHDSAESTLVAHLGRALRDALGIAAGPTSMADLLACLEDWTGPTAILILDDLHEIAGPRPSGRWNSSSSCGRTRSGCSPGRAASRR